MSSALEAAACMLWSQGCIGRRACACLQHVPPRLRAHLSRAQLGTVVLAMRQERRCASLRRMQSSACSFSPRRGHTATLVVGRMGAGSNDQLSQHPAKEYECSHLC